MIQSPGAFKAITVTQYCHLFVSALLSDFQKVERKDMNSLKKTKTDVISTYACLRLSSRFSADSNKETPNSAKKNKQWKAEELNLIKNHIKAKSSKQ